MASVKDIVQRSEVAFRRLNFMQELYRDAYRLGSPNREGFEQLVGVQTPGENKQRHVYDSAYQDAWERLTNAIFVGMFPSWAPWVSMAPGSVVPEDATEELEERLQYPTKITTDSILATNFYTQVHPMINDLIAGTGAMEISEDPLTDVRYTSLPIYQLGLEHGVHGSVDATFRKWKVLARKIKDEFPNATIPPNLESQISSNADGDIEFLSAVIPEQVGLRTHRQYIIWSEGPAIIETREFFENPVVVPRWSVLTGEIYGRGPALKATATAYSLNECAKLILMAANMGIFGMWTVTDDGINPDTVKFGPNALIPVDSNDSASPSMRRLESSAQMEFGQFAQEDLRSQIKRNFWVDQLGNVEGPKGTATEVIERQALVMQDMGAAFGRINSEFTGPAITRHINILARLGKLPPIKVDGKVVALKYSSPLARAQYMEEVNAMRGLREENALHAAVDPSEAARLDRGAMQRRQAALTGIDMKLVHDDETVQAITTQIAEAQVAMDATAEGA